MSAAAGLRGAHAPARDGQKRKGREERERKRDFLKAYSA
jgi:hypothetical protein